jgi:hypothetical protein
MNVMINGQFLETDDMSIIRSALRDARKAEAAERKARKLRERETAEASKLADVEALRNAYYLLEGKASGRRFGHRAYCAPDARYSPVKVIGEFPETILSCECEGGTVRYESYHWRYGGCVMSGGGHCMALFLIDRETHEQSLQAIGAATLPGDPQAPGVYSFRTVSGITHLDFDAADEGE